MDVRRRCPTTLVCRVFPTSHNRQTEVCRWSLDLFSPESHQRSWWIVHTQPTKRAGHTPVPNPTNAVSGSFISGLQKVWRTPFEIPPNCVDMGLQKLRSSLLLCRQSMNDPPKSLVGLGR